MTNEAMREFEDEQGNVRLDTRTDMARKRETLRNITLRLEHAGVDYVIGGSGMLLGLGLVDDVRDWDLMTDALESEVYTALAGLDVVDANGPSDLFGSGSKLRIEGTEPEVEVIIGFAIRAETGVCRMPALSAGVQKELRIASPEVWFVAYALMGRLEKADMLERYLRQRGADPYALSRLFEEPLPAELVERLSRFPEREDPEPKRSPL